ncbi:MAG: hypothetical protein AAF633_22835 [Chloroflexota bacterium]
MKVKTLTEEQNQLLESIWSAGVVVEYLLATRDESDKDDYHAHRQTALLALEKIQKDTNAYFENLIKMEAYQHKKREDFFQIVIDSEKLIGEKRSLQQFMGRFYDIDRRRAAIRGRSSSFLNSYFWAGDEETDENVIDTRLAFPGLKQAYAYAFFEPPYTSRGTAVEKETLFHAVERVFFDGFDAEAQIWSWPADSSNYFNAGKEWWGTFFYTYSLPGTDTILGIAASATD